MKLINAPSYHRADLWFILICSVILVVLNVIRIVNVPVTYDEALTYNSYVTSSFKAIIHLDSPAPNNHIFSTLITKFFVERIGNNVFFLRATGLLGQLIFLFFSVLICKLLFKNKLWIIGGFLLINMNPFLFEFFGLCRGYGLSMGLMIGSVYFLLCYLKTGRYTFLAACLLFSAAAIYANFTLINYLLALFTIIILQYFIHGRAIPLKRFFLEFSALTITSAILFLLIAGPIQKLIAAHQLDFGGDPGFIHDTVYSLVGDYFFMKENDNNANTSVYTFIASIAITVSFSIWLILRKKHKNIYTCTFFLLLIIPALSTIIQHYITGTKFLISRTAIFFIPLYILLFLSVAHTLKPVLGYIVLLIAVIATSINFFKNYNTYEARLWQFDRYDLAAIKMINSRYHGNKITVGSSRWYTPVLQYYAATVYNNGNFAQVENIMEVSKNDTSCDYYFIEKKDIPKMSEKFRIDTIFSNENAVMVKKDLLLN